MFSAQTINLFTRMSRRADKAAGGPVGMDPMTIIALLVEMLPKAIALFAACKKQPPAPTPLPTPLAAVGVTQDSWNEANGAKFASSQSIKADGSFYPVAISRTGKEIAKAKHIKKKAARPMAVAALETGRDETVEDLAVAMQQAKNNATQLGV